MFTLATLFVVVLLLNLMPAFAPPTWMAMSWMGFNRPEGSPFLFALVAALAATSGRLILAASARRLVQSRLMRDSDRENIEAVRAWLAKRRSLTVGTFFLYALGPFPSNYLFIAYGLAGLPLKAVGAAFFVGRTFSYAAWAHLGRFAFERLDPESEFAGGAGGYLGTTFVISQLALLALLYVLFKLDWRALIERRTLAWRKHATPKMSTPRTKQQTQTRAPRK